VIKTATARGCGMVKGTPKVISTAIPTAIMTDYETAIAMG
jgi:hypothetical protein